MSELKPCPFCGGEAALESARNSPRDRFEDFGVRDDAAVSCRTCDAQVFGITDATAIAAWNRRIAALPQPITAETVRRVLDAMGGLIGSGAKPDDWLDHEAIAQRANDEIKNG